MMAWRILFAPVGNKIQSYEAAKTMYLYAVACVKFIQSSESEGHCCIKFQSLLSWLDSFFTVFTNEAAKELGELGPESKTSKHSGKGHFVNHLCNMNKTADSRSFSCTDRMGVL